MWSIATSCWQYQVRLTKEAARHRVHVRQYQTVKVIERKAAYFERDSSPLAAGRRDLVVGDGWKDMFSSKGSLSSAPYIWLDRNFQLSEFKNKILLAKYGSTNWRPKII